MKHQTVQPGQANHISLPHLVAKPVALPKPVPPPKPATPSALDQATAEVGAAKKAVDAADQALHQAKDHLSKAEAHLADVKHHTQHRKSPAKPTRDSDQKLLEQAGFSPAIAKKIAAHEHKSVTSTSTSDSGPSSWSSSTVVHR